MDEGYDGEGDFALWVSRKTDPGDDDYERPLRSSNLEELRQEARRLRRGKHFPTISIYRWNYQTEQDDILVEDFSD